MRFKPQISSLAASLSAIVALEAGCQKHDSTSTTDALTNRAQNQAHFNAVIRLKQPALLDTLDKEGKVSEAQREALEAEQAELLETLNDLSPEIKVIYNYKLVLNGFAINAPARYYETIKAMAGTSGVTMEESQIFEQGETQAVEASENVNLEQTSVDAINAAMVHSKLAAKGEGIRVGVIDTGIDYTHAMFGGEGTEEAYKANDVDLVEPGSFPTKKVVGGIDLVGEMYDPSSMNVDLQVPKPDNDPLDVNGHGTHVAGTIAGLGDGVKTYSGVAPEADLYAIKVFGAGSTNDSVVIAALEYAADPDKDGDPSDRLDVVNLSLGGGFGTPHILYSEAIKTLTGSGVVAAISAGNSGNTEYIVGAPSTVDSAISVAASIDNMEHNWKFPAISQTLASGEELILEAVEASFTKPVKEVDVSGKLVFIGLADKPLSDELKAELKGNVALIDRGAASFCAKAEVAKDGGATGFVVANNAEGDAFVMGGDCKSDLPGLMITQKEGNALKASMEAEDTIFSFAFDGIVERPELINTITDFSSRGPRSIDGLIKPEVSAPGQQIISASVGTGSEPVRLNGTSMSAPHIAGVAALVKQVRPDLSADAIKSLIVNTAVTMENAEDEVYSVSQQGNGLVDAFAAAQGKLAFYPQGISIGEQAIELSKTIRKTLTVENISTESQTIKLLAELDDGLSIELPSSLSLEAGAKETFNFKVKVSPDYSKANSVELDGFVKVFIGEDMVAKLPVLAVASKTSRLSASKLAIAASESDQEGALATLTLTNKGVTSGRALAFNKIGDDPRNTMGRINQVRQTYCDLQSAGYRVTKGLDEEGVEHDYLEFGIKIYNPITSWDLCDVSVLFDGDMDGLADQELVGGKIQYLTSGLGMTGDKSVLTDAKKMRFLRAKFEAAAQQGGEEAKKVEVDYLDAVLSVDPMVTYGHSTIAVLKVKLSSVAKTPMGDISVKIAALGGTSSPDNDDFLGDSDQWITLGVTPMTMAYVDLPGEMELERALNGKDTELNVEFVKGGGDEDLLLYFPENRRSLRPVGFDAQSQLLQQAVWMP